MSVQYSAENIPVICGDGIRMKENILVRLEVNSIRPGGLVDLTFRVSGVDWSSALTSRTHFALGELFQDQGSSLQVDISSFVEVFQDGYNLHIALIHAALMAKNAEIHVSKIGQGFEGILITLVCGDQQVEAERLGSEYAERAFYIE